MGPDVIRPQGSGINIVGVHTRDDIDNGNNDDDRCEKDQNRLSEQRIFLDSGSLDTKVRQY